MPGTQKMAVVGSHNISRADSDRANRLDVDFDAILKPENGSPIHITISNISMWGFQATSDNCPDVGEWITMTINGRDDIEGVIQWKKKSKFGVEAFEPIDVNFFAPRIIKI